MTNLEGRGGGNNVLSLFLYLKSVYFLLNFSDINGLKSPFRAPSSLLKCQFFLKLPFKDIHCQLSEKINIVKKYVVDYH
jgi:hypothetical protein